MPLCLNCDRRVPACHDTCDDFIKEKARKQAKKDALDKQRQLDQYRRNEHIGAFSAQRR